MPNKNLDRHVLVRMVQIDRQIRDGKYPNANTLAKEFELSSRTMQRDIEAMRDFLNADILYDDAKKGYYYPPGTPEIMPGLKLSDEERFILYLSELALPEIQPGTQKTFNNLLQKLYLADEMIDSGQHLSGHLSFDFGKGKKTSGEKAFLVLREAINKRLSVKMTYYTSWGKERSERVFDPYHIRWSSSSWLVIGHCHLRKMLRIFSISNIEKIEIMKQKFTIPKDFSPEEFIGNAWGIIKGESTFIKLRFSDEIAEWIAQRKWHKTQEIVFNKDGSMNLSLTVDGLSEIIPWILGWGEDVTVLEPPELVEIIKDRAKKILGNYD